MSVRGIKIPWPTIAAIVSIIVVAGGIIGWGYSAEERLCSQEKAAVDHESRIRDLEREGSEARQWRREKDARDTRLEDKVDMILDKIK